MLDLVSDLAKQTYPMDRLNVVVLDDGGSDGTAEVLSASRDLPYRLTVLRPSREGDYLSGRRWNECIAATTEQDVFIQVDDVRVRPDFVERHASWHIGSLSVVTGAKFESDEETWELTRCRRRHLAGPGGVARETIWTATWGASLSYPRTLVEAVRREPYERPFDERMTGWGFHEVEFAYRAVAVGARVIYDPAVGVFHQNHNTHNDRGRGIDHARHATAGAIRNEAYLLAKHGLTALPRW
ncbi:MAG: glycosyltransferase family 2 protein [Pseudonocardia sp.]|nr:glycosyltransferase family 2 protein [Pseudonocardia sp.]